MADRIITINENMPTGFEIKDQETVLNVDGKVDSVYLRGKAVYVQADEPTDMEENDIWIKI